jgi:hypothetical protein
LATAKTAHPVARRHRAHSRSERGLRQIEQARDRVLARTNGSAKVGALAPGNNSFSNRPNFLGNCCHGTEHPRPRAYVLKP